MIEILKLHIKNIKDLLPSKYDSDIFNAVMTLLSEFQERSYCLDISQKETVGTIKELMDLLKQPRIKNNNNGTAIYSEYNRIIKSILGQQSRDEHSLKEYLLEPAKSVSTNKKKTDTKTNESEFPDLEKEHQNENIKIIVEKLSNSKIKKFVENSTKQYRNTQNHIQVNKKIHNQTTNTADEKYTNRNNDDLKKNKIDRITIFTAIMIIIDIVLISGVGYLFLKYYF